MSNFVQTSIGILPQTWEVKPLAETTDKIQDGTHFSPQSKDGPCLYLTSKNVKFGRLDLTNSEWISQEEHDSIYARCDVKTGDVLLTKDGANTGNACLNTHREPFSLLSSVVFLRTDGVINHSGFILQYLLSPIAQRRLKDLMSGNAIPRLTLQKIKAFETPIPSPTIQLRIARILQTVDRATEKTEALIEKYQQIKAGLMHDLFTRGLWTQEELDRGDHHDTPEAATAKPGQLRPAHNQAPHLYQETPIGWIPKAWLISTCADVCEAVIDCKNRTPPITPDGHPVIRTPNVRNGNFIDQGLAHTDYNSYVVWTSRGKPKPGDVVITREAPVGEVCKIPDRHPESCLGQRMMLYRTDPEKILNDFFLYALQSKQIQTRLDLISGGSTVGHVRVGDIRSLWIFYPSSDLEQKMIAGALNDISMKLETEKSSLLKLQKQKSGLMHDLLTGKVPVTPDPDPRC